jgi:hypothetical protein
MTYSTLGFIESLKPRKRRFTTYFVDPISGANHGWIFELGPISILKVTGWMGEKLTVLKVGDKEVVW